MVSTISLALLLAMASAAQPGIADPTDQALRHCLDDAEHASTAGQTDCEAVAGRRYDARINAAYNSLVRRLPPTAAARLRVAQRAWLAFRDREREALRALYQTRHGTMYVPMAAANMTRLIRDRALQLEAYARVLTIDSEGDG